MAARGAAGGYGVGGDWELLFGSEPDAQAKAAALAQALRGQQADALALQALTGGPRAAPAIGQTMAANAQQEMAGLGQAAAARRQLDSTDRYHTGMLGVAQQNANSQEQSRKDVAEYHRRLLLKTPAAPKAPKYQIIQGADGSQFYVDPENPGAAQPILGPDGKPIAKPAGVSKLTESQGQAAMFLEQAQNGLKQAMEMGDNIMPGTGLSGLGESIAGKARIAGIPQLQSDDMAARQSILSAIAEPIVRAESGAAVPDTEVKRLALRYLPVPGESQAEHARKLKALVGAIGAVAQKLPPEHAAKFKGFQDDAARWAGGFGGGGPTRIKSDAEYNALPSGAKYIDPEGKPRTKR